MLAAPGQAQMLVAPGQAKPVCDSPTLGVAAGPLRSQWREYGARGDLLVQELGTLQQAGVVATGQCAGWQVGARFAQARGSRHYAGLSTTGLGVESSSQVRQSELGIETLAHLSPRWQWGLRLAQHRLHRDIASAGPVQGYPEDYRYWLGAAGLQFNTGGGPGWQVGAEAWLGAGPAGRLDIKLPNADPASLALGRSRSAELAAQLRWSPAEPSRWQVNARVQWAVVESDAGPAQALTRNGVLVGGAAQPRSRQSTLGLGVQVDARF